jgi:hypothetical protein
MRAQNCAELTKIKKGVVKRKRFAYNLSIVNGNVSIL